MHINGPIQRTLHWPILFPALGAGIAIKLFKVGMGFDCPKGRTVNLEESIIVRIVHKTKTGILEYRSCIL